MSENGNGHYTGGCQCGAVRFAVEGKLGRPSICHCRMCQKAFGAFYAPLVGIGEARLRWTRGAAKRFQSSNHVKRGFCADCGTPLTYEAPDGIALAIGAFDDPALVVPVIQYGIEGRLPYADGLSKLPVMHTPDQASYATYLATVTSYQHPDHETAEWPPHGQAT